MISKEALRAFIPIIELVETLPFKHEDVKTELTKGLCENIEIIKKDLEVLEILKKHSTRLDDEDWDDNVFNGIDYENLDEEERKVIKEWLNEK